MASKLPYLSSPGLIPKILTKIADARRPERFTQDFLGTKLGFTSGSAQVIIPLLKRLGFLSPDGVPTDLYDKFRNENTRGFAMATGLRNAYKELFDRNEYAYDLQKDKLTSLVTEITGAEKDSSLVKYVVSSFLALKSFADFEDRTAHEPPAISASKAEDRVPASTGRDLERIINSTESVGLNLAYTINLNLPESTNPEVFNAIFKSLRENLLK